MFTATRKFIIASVLLLFLSLVIVSGAFCAEYVSVKGDNVNVRTGAGTNYEVSMELFQGYPLKVISTQGEWLKIVDFENDSGWIHQSLVTEGDTVVFLRWFHILLIFKGYLQTHIMPARITTGTAGLQALNKHADSKRIICG